MKTRYNRGVVSVKTVCYHPLLSPSLCPQGAVLAAKSHGKPTGFLLIASHFSHADTLPRERLSCSGVPTDDSTGQHNQTQLLHQFDILSTVYLSLLTPLFKYPGQNMPLFPSPHEGHQSLSVPLKIILLTTMYVCGHVHGMMWVWRTEGNPTESVFSFYLYMGSWD